MYLAMLTPALLQPKKRGKRDPNELATQSGHVANNALRLPVVLAYPHLAASKNSRSRLYQSQLHTL